MRECLSAGQASQAPRHALLLSLTMSQIADKLAAGAHGVHVHSLAGRGVGSVSRRILRAASALRLRRFQKPTRPASSQPQASVQGSGALPEPSAH